MAWLVWTGTIFAVLGLLAVIYCIFAAITARRTAGDDAVLRDKLQRVVAINMAALLVSACGLMAVVIGVMLA
ncbi:MAG: hypothetical protein AAFN09_00795 [Pseudomonadota bacterium]